MSKHRIELIREGHKVYEARDRSLLDGMGYQRTTKIGIIDVPDHQYHQINEIDGKVVVSQSGLKAFLDDHEEWRNGIVIEKSRAMVLGSLLDTAILNPKDIDRYAFPEGKESNGSTKEGKAFKAVCEAKELEKVTPSEKNEVLNNIKMMQNNVNVKEILKESICQIQMISTVRNIGVRGMIDVLPDINGKYGDGICDMKRTGKFKPKEWRHHVENMKYHWQAALYLDLWNEICEFYGKPEQKREKWYFILASSNKPYGCGLAELSPKFIQRGREGYQEALKQLEECLTTNQFNNPWNQGDLIKIKDYGEE